MRRFFAMALMLMFVFGTIPSPMFAGQDDLATAVNAQTTTPIKYLVVIFDENISFDHYFGSYPVATNPPGEPSFTPAAGTPAVNGINGTLTSQNPNSAAPFRLDPSQASTCDNDNHYTAEQQAYDSGLLDQFVQFTSATGTGCTPNLAMGYYDGNTVTALWNYAQRFAMSDTFFATEFGTTVMGHLNLISGQTHADGAATVKGKIVNGSVIANVDPTLDDCSSGTEITMTSKNVGDLLNTANITWGWFYGDFTATGYVNGVAQCSSEYDGHYDPFLYYASTSNPHHLQPTSTAMIGKQDQANHQYDLTAFWNAVAAGNLPSVSFVKPPHIDNGHPSDSTPLLEQGFLVNTINQLQQSRYWRNMAIIVTYDDSDGWYDHVMPPIVSQSNDPLNDALGGSAVLCGVANTTAGAYEDRCGYGPRLPFLVISPYSNINYVDHATTDQTSILRFIEDNWNLGRIGDQSFDAQAGSILGLFNFSGERPTTLILDPNTGEPAGGTD